MSAEYLVRYCAPTLAGIKIGNLFSCKYDDVDALLDFVAEQNRLLAPRGVRMVLMRRCKGRALIYVYRVQKLQQMLFDPEIQAFLRSFGYRNFRVGACLKKLKQRFTMDEFPHDIGIFLGYPLSDVQAFIDNKGANCQCLGCWKAYSNILEAQKTFRSYKECTKIYCQNFFAGTDIARLTVAG